MNITLSHNEIRSEVEKAIRGAGGFWGQAKDGGVMAAELARRGLPFLSVVLGCLESIESMPASIDGGDKNLRIAATDGIILAEYVAGSGQSWSGEIIGMPFLIAGMAIVVSESAPPFKPLCLKNQDAILAYATESRLYIGQDMADGEAVLSAQDLTQDQIKKANLTPHPLLPYQGVRLGKKDWIRLKRYAFKTYVKETQDKRRRGAGAGDIDNA